MSWLTQKEPGKGNQNLERFLDFYLLKFALFISIFFFYFDLKPRKRKWDGLIKY